jgi:hypothetical protein
MRLNLRVRFFESFSVIEGYCWLFGLTSGCLSSLLAILTSDELSVISVLESAFFMARGFISGNYYYFSNQAIILYITPCK